MESGILDTQGDAGSHGAEEMPPTQHLYLGGAEQNQLEILFMDCLTPDTFLPSGGDGCEFPLLCDSSI